MMHESIIMMFDVKEKRAEIICEHECVRASARSATRPGGKENGLSEESK
jgi:hypothetical protein